TVINQVNASLAKNPLLSVELVLLGTILAAAIGGFLGFLASYPAIRLREDYLGMLLLASAQFFQIFLGAYYPLIGGTQGISVPDFFSWAGNGIGVRDVTILGFLTFQVASIGPGTWDRITWTFYIWVMVIIGGSGNNFGVATGALWFSFLSSGITQVQNALPSDLPIDVNWIRYLIFAALLLWILAFRPGGILPEKSSPTLARRTLSRALEEKPG